MPSPIATQTTHARNDRKRQANKKAVFFVLNGKTPKIIAWYDGGVFHFPDFECKSTTIKDADFRQRRNKTGALTVTTRDGEHVYKGVKNVKFAYDKLAILILKDEGLLND